MRKYRAFFSAFLMMLFSLPIVLGTAGSAATTDQSYDQYLSDYFLSDVTARHYINHDLVLPYRKFVEDRQEPVFQGLLAAWEIATFDGTAAGKADKAVAYYETILYDTIIGDVESGLPIIETLNSTASAIKAGVFKTIFEYCESLDEYELVDLVELENISTNDPLFNTLVDQLGMCQDLKEAFKVVNKTSDIIGDAKTIVEVIDRASALEALTENKVQMQQLLSDMGNSTSDPALALACTKMVAILDDTYSSQEVITGLLAGETLVKVFDSVTGKTWDAVLAHAIGAKLTIAVKAGQKAGKLAAGVLCSTDEEIECGYSMEALYEIENITLDLVRRYESRYKFSPNDGTAKQYNEAVKLLMKVYIEGADYSLQYAEITNEKGAINQLFKRFESEDYKEYVKLVKWVRASFSSFLEYVDKYVYERYLDGVPNEITAKGLQKIIVSAKTSAITPNDIWTNLSYSERVNNTYTNQTVDEDWTLSEDIKMFGNLTVDANIDLNGFTLTVGGYLNHNSGEILLHSGSLIIDGDYLSAEPNVNGGQQSPYNTSYGELLMVWDDDYMYVGGDFITNKEGGKYNRMSTGTLEVKGNVLDYTSYGNAWSASDTHKLVLSGTGTQTIHLNCLGAYFNDVEVQNSNTRTIIISDYCIMNGSTTSDRSNLKVTSKNGVVNFGELKSTNLIINGDVELGDYGYTELQKSDMEVIGNLTVSSNLDCGGCRVHVSGMLNHNSGEILLHSGSLIIDGDYLSAEPNVNGGQQSPYNTSYGELLMVWDDDYMYVGGDFITNKEGGKYNRMSTGTLEVKGNVLDYTSYGNAWSASDTHKLVLSGTGTQTIYLNCLGAYFNDVEVQSTNSRTLLLTGYFSASQVIVNSGSVTIKSQNADATISEIFMRTGAKVTLTGNMNGLSTINKASFLSDMKSSVSTSANTITAAGVGNANVTISNSTDSSNISVVVENPFEVGDVNCDGEISIADVVLLQKWLLAERNTHLPAWKYADMDQNGKLNAIDLSLLKRKIIYG